MQPTVNAKASNFINQLSIEAQQAIKEIAETIQPALDAIHATTPTTQDYYGDYLRLLSYQPKNVKILALAMLYAGANPHGVSAAVKLIG